jgi:hypothetical protein
MILPMVRKEILVQMQSARFAVALLMCLAIFGLNALALHSRYRAHCADYDRALAAYEETLSNRSPLGNFQPFVAVRPTPLGVFFHRPEEDMEGTLTHPPLAILFEGLDLVAAAGIFLSLIAVLFGYDAITGERSAGTLKLLLAGGVSRARILAAKLTALLIVCAVPFLIAVAAALALAWPGGVSRFGGGDWAVARTAGPDLVDLRDYRLLLGLERKVIGGLDGRLEVGYVFGRHIQFRSRSPEFSPSDTVLVRGGLVY